MAVVDTQVLGETDMKKTGRRKSRDTVPLKQLSPILYCSNFTYLEENFSMVKLSYLK
jgi:hypothetical protein